MPSPALCTNFEIPSSKTPAFPPHPVLPTIKYKKTPQDGLCGKRAKAARKFVTLITGEITWSCRKWIGNFWGLRTFAWANMKFTKLRLFLSSFFATIHSFLLTGSISYLPVFIRKPLLVSFLLLAEHIFQTCNQCYVFAKEHHSLNSRHKLLLSRHQRAVSTQEGNARYACLVAGTLPVDCIKAT